MDDWRRHRRVVAPSLNERIMNAVWDESAVQASDMLDEHRQLKDEPEGAQNVVELMKKITINVIGFIGFGVQRPYKETTNIAPPGFQMTFNSAMNVLARWFFLAPAAPESVLEYSMVPKFFKKIGLARQQFQKHLDRIISEERHASTTHNTILATLVRLSDASREEVDQKQSKTALYFTDPEVSGTLYAFTLAGFETTANTLTFCLLRFVLEPEWQDWIAENIDEVQKSHPNLDYASSFPLLTRLRAVMVRDSPCTLQAADTDEQQFETMRLNTPVSHMVRETKAEQTLRGISIPKGTLMKVVGPVVHVSPSIWGKDSLTFRPSRWCTGGEAPSETLFEPPKGTFIPWSSGPRQCPGIKMAQVEFVSVLAAIFSKWRVEIKKKPGETEKAARERIAYVLSDTTHSVALQLSNPDQAVLHWVPRSR